MLVPGRSHLLRNSFALVIAAASAWLAAAGCTPSAGAFCDKKCDCTSCTDKEWQSCTDGISASRDLAQKKGCSGQFDALFKCTDAHSSCVGAEFQSSVGCSDERAALAKCAPGAGLGNACEVLAEALVAKYQECNIQVDTGPTGNVTCEGAQAVFAQCYLGCIDLIDCPCIKDPTGPTCATKLQPYSSCIATCQNQP